MPGDHLPVKWRVQAHFSGKLGKPDQTDPAEQFLASHRPSAAVVVFRSRRSLQAVDSARGRYSDLGPKNKCTAHICGFPRPCKQLIPDFELINLCRPSRGWQWTRCGRAR